MAAVSCIVYMYHYLFIQLKLENLKAQLVLSSRKILSTAFLRDPAHTDPGCPWAQKVLMDPSLWGDVFVTSSFKWLVTPSRLREISSCAENVQGI